jgi:hypothetical protein
MSEVTVLVPLGDRQVEMRQPTDGALVVLSRTFRGLPKIENFPELSDEQRDRMVRNIGTLGAIVEAMIVKQADTEWLDDALISGSVSAEAVFESIAEAARKFNGLTSNGPAKKAAPVRRRGPR